MSDLKAFLFEQHTRVRAVNHNGEFWFVLNDVCEALAIANPRQAATRLDDDERTLANVNTAGGPQQLTVVNDAGLYSLILGSRKPKAHGFKRWVVREVLPTLRRTGVHEMGANEALARLLPYLHDQQLRVLHALEVGADDDGFVMVGPLISATGLSRQTVRRCLHLFEGLRVLRWEGLGMVRLCELPGVGPYRWRAPRSEMLRFGNGDEA